MIKHFAISRDGKYLGSIIAEKIVYDETDDYLLFIDGSRTVAMFPLENISIEHTSFDVKTAKLQFQEHNQRYQD